MNECYSKKYILNGEIQPAEQFDNTMVYDGDSIYEVIRMLKGCPVFFYDHMERLESSTRFQKKKMLADVVTLRKDIVNLTKSDKKKETNLKIVFNYNGDSSNYLIYFIESIYPTDEQYRKGVQGILFYAERKDPGSKVINHKLRSSIYHKLILEGGYEALLVNENGGITEGSRSNIFFLKDGKLITAPDSIVLSGITRKHILEICVEQNIPVNQECVIADRITDFEAVFMTGTSPMVLPFCSIDDKSFKVGDPIIEQLRQQYILRAGESINRFRTGSE